MINGSMFNAATICLTALDSKEDAPVVAAWTQDSRYIPLSVNTPPYPMPAAQAKRMLDDLLKEADEKRNTFWFGIRTLDETELLGICGLDWVDWSNGAAFIELTMKDLAAYSQPSTQEALVLIQRYVFHELQMHRLSLRVPAYNEELAAVLQRMGFAEEVRRREASYRFGRRWDVVHFGLLARDWEKRKVDD